MSDDCMETENNAEEESATQEPEVFLNTEELAEAEEEAATVELAAPEQKKIEAGDTQSDVQRRERTLFQISSIRCLHILLKHAYSRNPTSWRKPHRIITRSIDDAIEQILNIRARILLLPVFNRRKAFEDAARRYSDCKSAQKGGDLGVFFRGRINKTFGDAAFLLAINDMSHIVTTVYGVHIIFRVA